MIKNKINIKKLVFEFLSVSFAVFIALIANQWRDSYNKGKSAQNSIQSIRVELTENKENIETILPNHIESLRQIDSLIQLMPNDSIDIDVVDTLKIKLVGSSAWEMSKLTKAVYYIDFDEVNILAKVYTFQGYYESIVKNYIIKGSNTIQDSDLNELRKVKNFLESIIPLEKDLKGYYNDVLTEVLVDQ